MSTTICKIMKNALLLLCLAVMTACAQRNEPTTQAQAIAAHELDSMQMCLKEFDIAFSLDDNVAESDEGLDALNAWSDMLTRDTIDVTYARSVFSVLAHEMLFVLDAQLDCDPDDQTTVEFDNQWRKFLLYWTDQL